MTLPARWRDWRPWGVAIGVFVVAGLSAAWLISQLEELRTQRQRAEIAREALDHAQAVRSHVDRAMSANLALAALVRQGGGSMPGFATLAREMLPSYPGASHLLLAPGGVIREVEPLAGNEAAIGLNVLTYPPQRDEAQRSRDTGALTLAGPLDLVQGGSGLVGRLPVTLDGPGDPAARFWGFTAVVMRLPQALEPARLGVLAERGRAYELWRVQPGSGARQTIAAAASNLLTDPVEQTLPMLNGSWTLSVAPIAGWGDHGALAVDAAVGTAFALLLGWLAKLLTERSAHAVRESEARLAVTLESTQIGIWDWDVRQDRWRASPTYYTMLGYTPESGDASRDVWLERVHPDDRATVRGHIEAVLRGRASSYQYEARLRHADGQYRWFSTRGQVVRHQPDGKPARMLGVRIDISTLKDAEERIHRLAHFDELTGLPNRAHLQARVGEALDEASAGRAPLALLFIDLDRFKNVNDALGHQVGDDLLREVGRRIAGVLREPALASRQGGDEFVVALPNVDASGAAAVAEQLQRAIVQRIDVGPYELHVTPSMGIAMYPKDGEDFASLLRSADIAMYRAKRGGRNDWRFFSEEMRSRAARISQIEAALHRAVERGELSLQYQPQVSLGDGSIVGVEALVRWQHPQLGSVSPGEFIPVAEDSGQILQVGEWVLREATLQMKRWIDAGIAPRIVAVNLSAVQFRHPDLLRLVEQILADAQLPPDRLELELTEGVAMDDPVGAIAVMDALHGRGIRLSIDDFGTGYSSMNYLKRFHIDKLKIDQSFVRSMTDDPQDRAIVQAIIRLAGILGLHTIAEGVETPSQRDFLRAEGCDEAQGYCYARPLPPDQFEAYVRAQLEELTTAAGR